MVILLQYVGIDFQVFAFLYNFIQIVTAMRMDPSVTFARKWGVPAPVGPMSKVETVHPVLLTTGD